MLQILIASLFDIHCN